MDAKAREIDKVIHKLGMETNTTGELHAWLKLNGALIVRTRRSLGKGKFVPADKIRCQLKVNEKQFSGLQDCDVSKPDYVKILSDKGIIPQVIAGQTFQSDDRGIEVNVVRVGSANHKARFRIKNLKPDKANYTITIYRKSGADPDRINYKTDNRNGFVDHELGADVTAAIEIKRL
jgi:hypothetical protein